MSALRHGRIYVECPSCGKTGAGPGLLSDWKPGNEPGEGTYLFACCGARHGLDAKRGGARSWVEPRGAEEPETT